MAEYIEREALLKAVSAWRVLVKDLYDCGYDDCITAMEDTISDAPAADVEPVRRGRWVWEANYRDYDGDIYSVYSCSVCGVKNDETTNYCKNCGAKMGGEENGK